MSAVSKFVAINHHTSCPSCGHDVWYSSENSYPKCLNCQKILIVRNGKVLGIRESSYQFKKGL